jgi:hypothetical protein
MEMSKRLSVDREYQSQLEDNFLRHIGYEYAELLCEELDTQQEQWQEIHVPESMDRLIHELAGKESKRKRRSSAAMRILRRVAIFVLLFFGLNYFLIVNVEAYRIQVMKAIVKFQSSFLNIDYVSNDGMKSYPQPDAWVNLYYLSYLPEGYTMTESNNTTGNIAFIFYKNEEGDQIAFQQYFTQTNMQIDTENAKVTNVSVNGEDAILVEKEDFKIMTWLTVDRAIYLETHNLPYHEVLKIADNMKLVEE